jgi:hypothetical protein
MRPTPSAPWQPPPPPPLREESPPPTYEECVHQAVAWTYLPKHVREETLADADLVEPGLSYNMINIVSQWNIFSWDVLPYFRRLPRPKDAGTPIYQHQLSQLSVSSKYYPGLTLLDFSDQMGTRLSKVARRRSTSVDHSIEGDVTQSKSYCVEKMIV